MPPQVGGEMSLMNLGRYAGKAGKKAAEMGRFFASEWLREPGAQQMLVDKATPFLKSGIDQLSTAIRPKRNYKTNRKDLDGGKINFFDLVNGPNYAPWIGKGVDIHKAIGKLPKPKSGFTLPGHKYTGPYNPLDQQLRFDPQTGEILEFYVKPTGKTDAAQHDVDYSVCEGEKNVKKCKNKADRKMVKSLDSIPRNERQYGHWLARNIINTKQKLGLGAKKRQKEMNDDWHSLLAAQLHKPVKRNFPKRRVLSNGIDEIWAADLVEMGKFSKWNKGIKYLLMVIDVFSKFGWIEPLKDKRGESVSEAFKNILSSGRHPCLLWTDRGSEFYNANFKRLLNKHHITLYSTENEEKSSVVERWNQTMKNRLWKMFSANNNTIYFDKLGKVVDEYNNSFHTSVKMTPAEASRKKNERKVYANLFGDLIYSKTHPAHVSCRRKS